MEVTCVSQACNNLKKDQTRNFANGAPTCARETAHDVAYATAEGLTVTSCIRYELTVASAVSN